MKVMLDRELAELYEVETAQLKRAVRRNIDRFSERFHVRTYKKGIRSLEMPIWHLQ
jgi:hypothetical protein